MERTFEDDGEQWTARVVGRADGARGSGPLPLLQLRFSGGATSEPRSAVVAGSSLGSIPEDELVRALARAKPVGDEESPGAP